MDEQHARRKVLELLTEQAAQIKERNCSGSGKPARSGSSRLTSKRCPPAFVSS
jgi:hypothetical protein